MEAQNDCPQQAVLPSGPDDKGGPVCLPLLRVKATKEEVSGFARAIGAPPGEKQVPLAFPIRWLALPPIRDWITRSIGKEFLPVHEAQNFVCERELELEAEYVLHIEARQSSAPARLVLSMSISEPAGVFCAACEAVLRLVPVAADAA